MLGLTCEEKEPLFHVDVDVPYVESFMGLTSSLLLVYPRLLTMLFMPLTSNVSISVPAVAVGAPPPPAPRRRPQGGRGRTRTRGAGGGGGREEELRVRGRGRRRRGVDDQDDGDDDDYDDYSNDDCRLFSFVFASILLTITILL